METTDRGRGIKVDKLVSRISNVKVIGNYSYVGQLHNLILDFIITFLIIRQASNDKSREILLITICNTKLCLLSSVVQRNTA